MRAFTFLEYRQAGCFQAEDAIGLGIHAATNGRMCDGCPAFKNRCEAYAKLPHMASVRAPVTRTETVREEAKRRGVSINEVRRLRATGAHHHG